MIRQFSRSTVAAILLGTALAVPFAPAALAQPCADPRGNSYCHPDGQVTFDPPPGGSQPSLQPCADPRGNAYCTNGGLVGQNPAPGGLVGQNTSAAQTPQNSQVIVSSSRAATNGNITVDPPTASAGDTVTVNISGLPANAGFVVNLGQLKTAAGQIYGAKNMQPADGATLQADPNGNFSGTFTVPTVPDFIAPQGSVCAVILGSASYCAPLSLQSVGLGSDGQASVDPAAGPVDGSGTTYCYSCQVLTNDDARRYGTYNSGSGNYEYHGARP